MMYVHVHMHISTVHVIEHSDNVHCRWHALVGHGNGLYYSVLVTPL